MTAEKINVPDLGTDDSVEVIEILVKPGDTLKLNDSMVVLESDKAAMEIPATQTGVVKEVLVKVGAQVKTGTPLLILETGSAASIPAAASAPAAAPAPAAKAAASSVATPAPVVAAEVPVAPAASSKSVETIAVPDLGGATDVEVIDILVKVGDIVKKEQGLVTLETDKAAMEVPSPKAGKVVAIKIKLGDKVAQGAVILDLEVAASAPAGATAAKADVPAKASSAPAPAPQVVAPANTFALVDGGPPTPTTGAPSASPSPSASCPATPTATTPSAAASAAP